MNNRKILAADFWPIGHFGDPNIRFDAFVTTRAPAYSRVIEALLTHDTVYVPTDDYLSLAAIHFVFGEAATLRLMESKAISLLRVKGKMAYIGNGGGLQSFSIQAPDGAKRPLFAPMDEALDWMLSGLPNVKDKVLLAKEAMNATTEIAISAVAEGIRRETVSDFLAIPTLRKSIGKGRKSIDRIPGIAPNEVRIYGGADEPGGSDDIGQVLQLAHANLEFLAANEVGADDISTACDASVSIDAKQNRIATRRTHQQRWLALKEIADIPDVAKSILSRPATLQSLLRLRDSPNGREFREWFHTACANEPDKIPKEYVRLLKSAGLTDHWAVKGIRFLATTAAGVIGGDMTGGLAGAADSFVVDRILRRPSAKIFLEKLQAFDPNRN